MARASLLAGRGGTVETPTGVSKQLYDNAIVQEVHAVDIKKIAAGAATAGVIGLGGLGVGAGGLAHADPPHVTPPGGPGNSDHGNGNGNGQYQWPPMVTGPGVNAGTPGNPLPPGQGFLPPPGHGGPALDARISYPRHSGLGDDAGAPAAGHPAAGAAGLGSEFEPAGRVEP